MARAAVTALAIVAALPALAAPPQTTAPPPGWPSVPADCADCGVVESVTPGTAGERVTGVGAATGALLGGMIGHQIGDADNRRLLSMIGAIGGGLIGHAIERHHRAERRPAEVVLRMADGSRRVVQPPAGSALPAPGDWVRVDGDRLQPIGPERG